MKKKIIINLILIIITFFNSIYFSKLYFENKIKKLEENNSIKTNASNETKSFEKVEKQNQENNNDSFSIRLSFAGDTMLASHKDQHFPAILMIMLTKKKHHTFLKK